MGIQVEFNPDLALRNISEFKNGNRKKEECMPENIEAGKTYPFLKEGQRKEDVGAWLVSRGLSKTARPQELSVDEWIAFTQK